MPLLQKCIITALVLGATIAAPTAAFGATGPAIATQQYSMSASTLHTPSAVPAKIRQVSCRSYTFNVYHNTRRVTCYEGTGVIMPDIKNVYRITTGMNAGFLCVLAEGARKCANFHPDEVIFLQPGIRAELVFLEITHV